MEQTKTIQQLTHRELRGLVVSILREEFGFTWMRIAGILETSDNSCRHLYKQFNNIYKN